MHSGSSFGSGGQRRGARLTCHLGSFRLITRGAARGHRAGSDGGSAMRLLAAKWYSLLRSCGGLGAQEEIAGPFCLQFVE
jgi:hypothetical protein